MCDAYLHSNSKRTKVNKKIIFRLLKKLPELEKNNLLEEYDEIHDKETKSYHRKYCQRYNHKKTLQKLSLSDDTHKQNEIRRRISSRHMANPGEDFSFMRKV